jgi:hypothetical protein
MGTSAAESASAGTMGAGRILFSNRIPEARARRDDRKCVIAIFVKTPQFRFGAE